MKDLLAVLFVFVCALVTIVYTSQDVLCPGEDDDLASPFDSGNYCQTCIDVVQNIETNGCAKACDIIKNPLGNEICNLLINKADLCQKILEWFKQGFYPATMCEDIGMCAHNSTCVCGVCTSLLYDVRCLSVPNKCPSSQTPFKPQLSVSNESPDTLEKKQDDIFCVDHACGSGYDNCCLTCF